MDVLVGGIALPLHVHNHRHWVEMDLQHDTSYDTKYEDKTPDGLLINYWPVTPFTVRALNNSAERVNVDLYIDGAKVDGISLRENSTHIFQGFRDGEKVTEFLFALPRYQHITDGGEIKESVRASAIGTITLLFFKATQRHDKIVYGSGRQSGSSFRQANKDEAAAAAMSSAASTPSGNRLGDKVGTAREGRVIHTPSTHHGPRKVTSYTTGEEIERVTVHYRERHMLEHLGVVPPRLAETATALLFNALFDRVLEVFNKDWRALLEESVQTAAQLQIYKLPYPMRCYPARALIADCIKFTLNETMLPRVSAGSRQQDEQRLSELALFPQDRSVVCKVTEDFNDLCSAAAVALFGTEELYFLVRLVLKHHVAAHPSRYPEGLTSRLDTFASEVDSEILLQVLADCTGVHWLLHLSACEVPFAFRPSGSSGSARGLPAYALARLTGQRRCHVHAALIPGSDNRDMCTAEANSNRLKHNSALEGRKRKRANGAGGSKAEPVLLS